MKAVDKSIMTRLRDLRLIQINTFTTVMVIIFISECIIMLLLSVFAIENHIIEMLLDSTLLTLATAPFIYHFMLKKLIIKNEELLNKLEQKVNGLNVVALVTETDLNGVIISANDLFCRVSGYTEKELIGRSHFILRTDSHSNKFWSKAWEIIKSGKIWKEDICYNAKDGSKVWVESSVFPIVDYYGKITGFTTISTNITQRELVKENLELAVAEAKGFADSKSLFLANMSHEIRTPMNGVLGMTQLLSESDISKEQEEMIDAIKACGTGLLVIMDDILDLSKIDANKLQIEEKLIDLSHFIKGTLFLFSANASQKNIILKYSVDDAVPKYLAGDETRIRQVISNFLSNAIKFTPRGGAISINITCSEIDEDSLNLSLEVVDNGIGIKEEDFSKLFKTFSQADSTTTRRFGGTGLGLTISKKLIEMMKGEVTFSSKFGEGTNMGFKIPLRKVHILPTKSPVSNVININELISEVYGHRILLVEDNIVNQKIAKMMLKKIGYECDIANNGQEALDALMSENGNKYTLIFMDMQMPEMDGITATKEIISKYNLERPKIVAMTANVLEEDKQKCFDAGMDDFISKPVLKADLIDVIKRIAS